MSIQHDMETRCPKCGQDYRLHKGDEVECVCPIALAAPASVPTPAIDPRHTVGAVVRDSLDFQWVVTKPGMARIVEASDAGEVDVSGHWTFSRWATREECERHGIPYVARTAPASAVTRAEQVEKALAALAHLKARHMHEQEAGTVDTSAAAYNKRLGAEWMLRQIGMGDALDGGTDGP